MAAFWRFFYTFPQSFPMRYAAVFSLMALAWISVAVYVRGIAWLLLWPVLSYGLVGAAYWRNDPQLFGKRTDGTMRPLSLIALLPYLVMAWVAWAFTVLLSSEPAAHEISPGLWIGRRPRSNDLPAGVAVIIDLTCEMIDSIKVRSSAAYLCVPMLDGIGPPETRVQQVIERARDAEGPVLIHCAQGHRRSAIAAAAILVARGHVQDAAKAIEQVAQRPGARMSGKEAQEAICFVAKFATCTAKP